MKNKIFNFFSYEQWRKTDPNDFINTAAHRSRAPGQLLAVSECHRRASDDLRPVQHRNIGERAHRHAPAVRRQHHSCIDGWIRSLRCTWPDFGRPTVPARPSTTSTTTTSRCRSDTLPQHFKPHGLQLQRQVALLRTIQQAVDAGHDIESNRIGVLCNDRGSQRDATSISGDAVWMLSPTTVVNINGTYHSFIDASAVCVDYAKDAGRSTGRTRSFINGLREPGHSGTASANVDHGNGSASIGCPWVRAEAPGISGRTPTASASKSRVSKASIT